MAAKLAHLLFPVLFATTLMLATGCKQQAKARVSVPDAESASTTGVATRQGSYLAYQIDLTISLPAELIAARLEGLRSACEAQTVEQSCSLLSIEQSQDQGSIQMRAAPAAIDGLTRQAAASGQVTQRRIKAEDLTEALDDNALASASLALQHEKFKALLSRPDVNVSDAITLARELSSIEASAQTQDRDRQLLLRRVETNLLQIAFTSTPVDAPSPGFWQVFSAEFEGFDQTLAEALSEIIIVLVYILPLIFAMLPVVLAWRWLWRKLTGKDRNVGGAN